MTDKQDCDLQLTLNPRFGEKLLNSIRFPWSVQYDLQPAYYPFDILDKDEQKTREEFDDEGIANDVLVEPLQQRAAKQTTLQQEDEESLGEECPTTSAQAESDGERRYKIDIHSVSLVVPNKPTITLGNPVKISDLTVQVKARFKASIRVFGKEYSTHKSTPWVSLHGRSATLRLCAEGAKIMGTVNLDDIDLVAKVKIFKWHYDCQLGLTKIMNRQLAKRSAFELLDLSGFQRSLIPDAENITVERIAFDEAQDRLLVKLFINNPTCDPASHERY